PRLGRSRAARALDGPGAVPRGHPRAVDPGAAGRPGHRLRRPGVPPPPPAPRAAAPAPAGRGRAAAGECVKFFAFRARFVKAGAKRNCNHPAAGSMIAVIDPLQSLELQGSGPKAWIWSCFNSACSFVVVSTTQRPDVWTSRAIWEPFSGG